MLCQDAITKIEKYLASDTGMPLIVNVQNRNDLAAIEFHFSVGTNRFVDASLFGNKDETPQYDRVFQEMHNANSPLFIRGLSVFMKLEGEQVLSFNLRSIKGMQIDGHVIILTYQCAKYLQFDDIRIKARSQVICIDGEVDIVPKVIFINPKYKSSGLANCVDGIGGIASKIEKCAEPVVYVKTAKHQKDFSNSIFMIKEIESPYDALLMRDPMTSALPREYGTDRQWEYASDLMVEDKKWSNLVIEQFGSTNNLDNSIPNYNNLTNNNRWLFFIALKLYGAKNNAYLGEVAREVERSDKLVHAVYRTILSMDYSAIDYPQRYDERKRILKYIEDNRNHNEVMEYCKVVLSKGKSALWYLTDQTEEEKKKVIELLDQYGSEYSKDELKTILQVVYPELAAYLGTYRFKNELLDTYFEQYKYQKVINKLLPEFKALVDEQALKREYNAILQPRSSYIEKISTQDTIIYFIDAMGVEYLSFILHCCDKSGLLATNVTICKSELPSLTFLNKEFVDAFKQAGCKIIDVKKLDENKHHGTENFDYQSTKLPLYFIEELKILSDTIIDANKRIRSGECNRVILISDHGASRLAVLNENENQWEMSVKGEHSGRCCPTTDIGTKPDASTEENEFWVLANYDRFKGGRKANVEVHGGASLEELTVPIIEIIKKPESIETFVLDEYKTIYVSYKKQASIKFYISEKLENISILIEGKYYDAVKADSEYVYEVNMPDIKKAKEYSCDIYAGNNLIATGLRFAVKKEGSSERNLL